jgi:hypothetical protein
VAPLELTSTSNVFSIQCLIWCCFGLFMIRMLWGRLPSNREIEIDESIFIQISVKMQKIHSQTRDLDFHEADCSCNNKRESDRSLKIAKPRNREIDRREVAQTFPMSHGPRMEWMCHLQANSGCEIIRLFKWNDKQIDEINFK